MVSIVGAESTGGFPKWLHIGTAALAVLFSTAGSPAEAQPAPAEQHYQQGKAYFRVGEYALCVKEFEASYALVQKSGALFNRARCHEELGQSVSALKYYRAYLDTAPQGPQAIEAKARSAALERKLIEAEAASAVLPAKPVPPPSNAPPATTAPEPARRSALAPEVAPPNITKGTVAGSAKPASDNTRRNLALGSAALGAVGLGVATIFAVGASSDWDDAQQRCPNGSPCDDPTGIALSEDAANSGNMATVFTGVSIAALAAAGYFWFTRPDGTPSKLQLSPEASTHGGSVQLQVKF